MRTSVVGAILRVAHHRVITEHIAFLEEVDHLLLVLSDARDGVFDWLALPSVGGIGRGDNLSYMVIVGSGPEVGAHVEHGLLFGQCELPELLRQCRHVGLVAMGITVETALHLLLYLLCCRAIQKLIVAVFVAVALPLLLGLWGGGDEDAVRRNTQRCGLRVRQRVLVEGDAERGSGCRLLILQQSFEQSAIHALGVVVTRPIEYVGLGLRLRLLSVGSDDPDEYLYRLAAAAREGGEGRGDADGQCLCTLHGLSVRQSADGEQHQSVPALIHQVAALVLRQFHGWVDSRQQVHVLELPAVADHHRQEASQFTERSLFVVAADTCHQRFEGACRHVDNVLVVCPYKC